MRRIVIPVNNHLPLQRKGPEMSLSSSAPWRRYYGDTPETLVYPEKTMYQLLSETAARYPTYTAFSFQGKHTDYRTLMARVDAAARGLGAMGIGKGDRVTICLPNCPQVLDCLYGLSRIGAVANMIHPLSAAKEIAAYLALSQSRAILTLDRFYPKVAEAAREVARSCEILTTTIAEELPAVKRMLCLLTGAGRQTGITDCRRWSDVCRTGAHLPPLPQDDGKAGDPAVILYSGGTTGTPKGIQLSGRNLNAMALQTITASGFDTVAGMKILAVLPNFHGFGLGVGIHTALVGGAACLLVPRFSAKSCARILVREKPQIILGVPALFEALLREQTLRWKDLSFLKGVFSGGDSLRPALKKKVDAFLRDHHCAEQIREGYGATECVAASCLMPRRFFREGSIGVPYPDTLYKIVFPGTTEEAPPLSEGEICLSGPTVMLGYMDDPAESAAALRVHSDGKLWLHTGDLGCMDADGFVYFKQRIKRMIVTNGYNVYPTQLENILESHEKVGLSCVIGVADACRGQYVRAYVVPAAGVEATKLLEQDILAHCSRFIAKYALPREIIFRAELPKTPVGKVAYRVLEAQAREEKP